MLKISIKLITTLYTWYNTSTTEPVEVKQCLPVCRFFQKMALGAFSEIVILNKCQKTSREIPTEFNYSLCNIVPMRPPRVTLTNSTEFEIDKAQLD